MFNNIASKRAERGMTQQELADLIHEERAHVSRWETGKYNPNVITALKIAKALKCKVEDLFSEF